MRPTYTQQLVIIYLNFKLNLASPEHPVFYLATLLIGHCKAFDLHSECVENPQGLGQRRDTILPRVSKDLSGCYVEHRPLRVKVGTGRPGRQLQ